MDSSSDDCAHPFLAQRLESFRFALLFLVLLDFTSDPATLVEIEGRVLSGALLGLFRTVVLSRKLQRSTYLINKFRELLRRLRGHGFDVSLEDKKVLSLHKDVERNELRVICVVSDNTVVQLVF